MKEKDMIDAFSAIDEDLLIEAESGNARRKGRAGVLRFAVLLSAAIFLIAAAAIPFVVMKNNGSEQTTENKGSLNSPDEQKSDDAKTTFEEPDSPTAEPGTPTYDQRVLAMAKDLNRKYNNEMTKEEKDAFENYLKEKIPLFFVPNPETGYVPQPVVYIDSTISIPQNRVELLCYGKFSGCTVWFSESPMTVIGGYDLAGCSFRHSSYLSIMVLKDGAELPLPDAYRNGWLTEGDIVDLADIHRTVETVAFNNGALYDDPDAPEEIETAKKLKELF